MTRGHSVPLPCRILAGLLVVTLVLPPHLLANPQGGQVRQGQVRIDASPGQLRIHQQSQRAVIDWESFSIDRGEVTRFLQPNASAAALNRVRGDSASRIEGMLRANGNVYLINPNGILIGPSGTIDVGGFVASTLDTADDDFMRGGDLRFSGHGDAAIINLGSISALDGDVVLMAGSVLNAGTIRAPRGTAALAAGNDILLAESGEERVFVRGSGGSRKAEGVTNTGEIEANIAELKAHGGNLYGMAVKNEGRVAATGVTRSGGQIFLSAGGGKVRSTGSLKAKKSDGSGGRIKVDSGTTGETEIGGTVDASGETGSGGEIVILGNEIEVFDGTLILNDGETGGGRTFVGGGRHGADASLANATNLSIGGGSLISANARGTGDGGEIVLFATDTASVHGLVSAQGGAYGGDGGFIELSGQGRLYVPDLVGQVRLSAPLGASGTLLLDPANINVIHGTGGGIMGTTMTDGALMDVLANFPVLIWTSDYGVGGDGDITFAADVNVTWSSSHSLTFQADRDLIFLAGAQIFASGSGAFNATAARSISVGNGASIRTTIGDLNLSANAAGTTTGNFVGVDVNGGLVQSVGTGSVSVTGRGGNDAGGNQIGVRVRNGGDILGGTSGLVSVTGYGGASTGSGNIGVNVFSSATTTIGSAGANVEVTGTGGGGNASMGIELGTGNSNGRVTAGGLGTVTVHGTGGTQVGGAFLHGILMGTSTIDSAGGNVSVTGIGGSGSNPSGDYTGIQMDDSIISAGGGGTVTVTGMAGTAATSQTLIGVDVRFTSQITSAGGNVSVTGTGGNTTNALLGAGAGVRLIGNGTITAGGTGTVNVIGSGAGGSTVGHEGIVINGSGLNSNLARIGAANGTTALTATAGNGASHALVVGTGTAGRITTGNNNLIIISTDSLSVGSAGILSSGTGNTVINTRSTGTLINLGGADVLTGSPLTLGLTDAELDRITAGTLLVGSGSSGQITVSNAISHGNHLSLTTGAGVTINQAIAMATNKNLVIEALGTSTGQISLANATAALSVTGTGAISLTTARNVSFASGSSLTTVNGDLTLSANAAGTTTGNFVGISNAGSIHSTGTGAVTLTAVGGNSGSSNYGIALQATGQINSTGTGAVTFDGSGGGGAGSTDNDGILMLPGSSLSSNGPLALIGTAGVASGNTEGIALAATINVTGLSPVTLITDTGFLLGFGGYVNAGSNTVTLRQKTAGTAMNVGTFSPGALSINDGAMDLITAGLLQIGNSDSGQITVSNAISHTNHLSLTTGAGVTINQSIAMAANKNLAIDAFGTSTGQISLANSNAALSASGTGAISLTTARNISLASGSSVTTVNGDLSLSANAAGTTTGAFIGIDLSGATLTTNGTGAIALTGKGGAGTAATDLKGVRLRLDAVVQSTLAGAGAGSITINGTGGGVGSSNSNGVQIGGIQSSGTNNTRISSVSGAILVTGAAGGGTGNNQSGIDIRDGGKIISTGTGANSATITLIGTAGTNSSNDYNVGVQLGATNGNYVFGAAVTSVDGSISINGTGGSGNGFLNGIFIGDGAQVAASGVGGISLTGTGASGISTSNEGVRIFGQHSNSQASRVTAVNGTITIDGATLDADSHAVLVDSPAFVSTTGSGNIVAIGDSMNLTGTLNAGSNTVTFRQKTNGTGIDLGSIGGVVTGTLRLSDAELDRITAGTLFVGNGSSGPLTISSALTHGNHLTLATGGSVTINAGLTLSADKNLLIEAPDFSAGTISLATANADLGTSGSGSITIEAGRNLVLSPGSSITSVNGAISLTANRGPYPASGSLIGMDLESATVNTTGTGSITLSGRGGDATADQNGIRLRGGTSLATNGGNLTLLGEASDPLSSGIRIDLASLTSGGGVLELEGTGGNTSIDSPDTNATIGAPGDTVIVKSTSGAVGLFSQVRGYRLQLQDLGGADALDFTLNNSNNDIDQFNTLGNGPNGRIGTLVFREANGFRITDFLGGDGIAATGFLDLRATRFSGSSIVIDAPVSSQGGHITIVGRDVVVDGTEITTIGGGSLELNAGRAILVQGDSLLSVTDGELSVTAHQDEFYTTGTFTGLTILGSRVQSLGTGAIALYGKGGNGGTGSDFAYSGFTNPSTNGVRLDGGTVIASSHPSSSDFTLSIVGVGGQGASDSVGVVIANPDTVVSAASGTLRIEGFGGGQSTGQRNRGVLFTGGHIQATNLADITLYGAGGSGVNENDGIQLNSGARISAANGDMILDGYAGETLGIGVMLGNTAGNLSITGTGTVTVQGEGTNADGIVLGNAGAFVGGTNAGYVELQSTGDLRVQRELLASGGIFLNASAGGTIVDGEIHSTNGNIAIEGDDVTINAEVTADDGNIEIIFGDQPLVGESEAVPGEEIVYLPFNGTAAINDLLTASGWVRYFGGDGGGDLLTFASYTPSGVDLDFESLFNVEQVVGSGSSDDRLTGPSVASTYSFTGANAFQVGGVDFSAFENVLGGAANDSFAFSGSATLSGGLDGGGGTNTLDYTSYGTGVIIDLENGAATGITGGFENIASFTGSGNIDTITGPGSASTYTFTGPDALQVGSVSVSGFENLIAGPLEDEFVFLPGSRVSGTLDGGSSPTPVANRLNYSGYGAPVTVNLGTAPLSATGIAGGFSNVNQFLGSALATDRFIGPQAATAYQITGANAFSSAAFTASGFENLTGGIGSDTFVFAPGAALGGRLSGGTSPGVDTLDYSAFGRAVTVNIGPNTATGIGGGFLDLERIIGSSGNDRFNFLNQATIAFVDGGGGTDLLEINDSTLRGENTYVIKANSVSRNPLYTFNNFESLRLFLGTGNNTVNSDFFGYTQFIHGGAGYNTLNLPGISSLNQGNPIRNVYHYGIDAPRPDGNDTGGLLQLEVNQQNRGPNTGQGFNTENRFSIVDPGTLSQQIGALSGAFAAAVTAQASLIVVDGNPYLVFRPFSLDGSGITPSNLAIGALNESLGVDANLELAAAIGYTGPLFLFNPDGPLGLDLSGAPIDPAILTVLQESLAIAAASELSAAIGLNLVVSIVPTDGISPIALDGSAPGQSIVLLLSDQLGDAAQNELQAAIGTN